MANLKLLVTSILLCLFIGVQGQDIFKQSLVEKWNNQHEYLISCIELLDNQDLEFKPSEKEMTIRKLLLHMGSNMIWISESYLGADKYVQHEHDSALNKDQLVTYFDSLFEYTKGALQGVDSKSYGNKVDFFAGEKTVLQMMELIDDHLTHHKGQLTVYLRLLGKDVPKFVGW